MTVTVEDLKKGTRLRISSRELGQLLGVSQSTLSRQRWHHSPIPFTRDEQGRVWYAAPDVIEYFECQRRFSSTAQYAHGMSGRMEIARSAKRHRTVCDNNNK